MESKYDNSIREEMIKSVTAIKNSYNEMRFGLTKYGISFPNCSGPFFELRRSLIQTDIDVEKMVSCDSESMMRIYQSAFQQLNALIDVRAILQSWGLNVVDKVISEQNGIICNFDSVLYNESIKIILYALNLHDVGGAWYNEKNEIEFSISEDSIINFSYLDRFEEDFINLLWNSIVDKCEDSKNKFNDIYYQEYHGSIQIGDGKVIA